MWHVVRWYSLDESERDDHINVSEIKNRKKRDRTQNIRVFIVQ